MTSDRALLDLYDRHVRMRTGSLSPGYACERVGQVTRLIGPGPGADSNAVLHAELSQENADAAIATQIAFFRNLGHGFEWKHFSHDEPADLADRLKEAGFEAGEPETLTIFDLSQPFEAPKPDVGIVVDKLDNQASIRNAISRVNEAVYGDRTFAGWIADTIAEEWRADSDAVQIYAAHSAEEFLSVGWMRHRRGDAFGGLFGGSTLEAWRGRGLYSALVAARVEEAKLRDCAFLTVDCSPMSLPILERRGFRPLSTITPHMWSPTKES